MSATLSTIIRPAVTRRPASFSRLFNACWDGIARYFVRRAAIKTLRELDDRALQDIGLARSEIEAAVHGFITLPDRAMMVSAAIGPPADGRGRPAIMEAVPWN